MYKFVWIEQSTFSRARMALSVVFSSLHFPLSNPVEALFREKTGSRDRLHIEWLRCSCSRRMFLLRGRPECDVPSIDVKCQRASSGNWATKGPDIMETMVGSRST